MISDRRFISLIVSEVIFGFFLSLVLFLNIFANYYTLLSAGPVFSRYLDFVCVCVCVCVCVRARARASNIKIVFSLRVATIPNFCNCNKVKKKDCFPKSAFICCRRQWRQVATASLDAVLMLDANYIVNKSQLTIIISGKIRIITMVETIFTVGYDMGETDKD